MTSLSAQAGVSLAAHEGDIGAVFEDLLPIDSLTGVDPIPPTPFVWIKSAGDILDSIRRFCLRASNPVY